jgi:hypothetical protein
MESEGSLLCSQELAAGPYHGKDVACGTYGRDVKCIRVFRKLEGKRSLERHMHR